MSLPAVMFDFGNVLAFFDYQIIYRKLGARLGLDADAFRELVESRGMKGLLDRFESGRLTPEAFSAAVQSEVGLNITFEEFASDWQDIFELNAPVAAIAADLKRQGHTLLLGSNTNAIHAAFYRERFREALAVFEHFILSHEILAMKPGRAFFDACVAAVERRPSDCVFIDDVAENVEGARAAGLRGVVYRDPQGLVAELADLGVRVSTGS